MVEKLVKLIQQKDQLTEQLGQPKSYLQNVKLQRMKTEKQRAMSQLYQMYVEELSSVCYRYVPSSDDAKDVLQNSFVKIFTSLPTFEYRDESSFRNWMIKVVVNEVLHLLRERKRLRFTNLKESVVEYVEDEEPFVEHITADQLHQLISQLPDGYRTVINLYVFEGYSHQKIAEMLNITASTSASQLYFAKRLLSRKINEFINKRQ
ncbi:MAG: RNA polymerase sigma factor [Prevotella sp.]|nr:RNA polymerase sigma factor [Prevotella sp.]